MDFLYNYFVKAFAGTWTSFIKTHPEEMQNAAQDFMRAFQKSGCPVAFLIMLLCGAGCCLFYYYVFNNWPGFHFRRRYWVGTFVASLVLTAGLTYAIIKFVVLSQYKFNAGLQYSGLVVANMIYTALVFIVLSLVITWWAKKTTNTTTNFFNLFNFK